MLKQNLNKVISAVGGIAVILLIIFLFIVPNSTEIGQIFSSEEAFKGWINSLGIWAPLIYLLVQIGQILIAPIPGNITGLVGGAAFGWWWGFVLSGIGTIIGSCLAFYLGRWLGRGFVVKLVGERRYKKYSRFFSGHLSWSLVIIFLIPVFPDDILCILAGLSPLPFRRFLALVIVGRLPNVFITNLAGAGILNLTGVVMPWWGWLLVGLAIAGLSGWYWLNRSKVKSWLEHIMLEQQAPDIKPALQTKAARANRSE
jgi:uncharacterized membrane protein YdjX (TVP38/TMEM64 family)